MGDRDPVRIEDVRPARRWHGPAADTVVLRFDDRYRRRIVVETTAGRRLLLDLPHARVLREGDGLVCADGSLVEVLAAAEPVAEIRADDSLHLARIAWHLGNRHIPAEIGQARIVIRQDHVIIDMVRGLGGDVRLVEAPFEPEGGAYGDHDAHRHDHHGAHHAHDHSGTGHRHD